MDKEGIKVCKISNKDLELCMGKGRMPLLEDTTLAELRKKAAEGPKSSNSGKEMN